MHAHALDLLKNHLTEGRRGLDVGSGSGYLGYKSFAITYDVRTHGFYEMQNLSYFLLGSIL